MDSTERGLLNFFLAAAILLAVLIFAVKDGQAELDAAQVVRQAEISAFHKTHKCRPEGYVSANEKPVRTYRCDNGLFVEEDMK